MMSKSSNNNSRSVLFVGNIPYNMTQEHIIEICELIGPVVFFKRVTDKDTGKAKGYGFCEYRDEETAMSARRNLNGYDINGQQLKVYFASKNGSAVDKVCIGGPGLPQSKSEAAAIDYDKLVHHLATHYTKEQLNAYLNELRVLAAQDILLRRPNFDFVSQIPNTIV